MKNVVKKFPIKIFKVERFVDQSRSSHIGVG